MRSLVISAFEPKGQGVPTRKEELVAVGSCFARAEGAPRAEGGSGREFLGPRERRCAAAANAKFPPRHFLPDSRARHAYRSTAWRILRLYLSSAVGETGVLCGSPQRAITGC